MKRIIIWTLFILTLYSCNKEMPLSEQTPSTQETMQLKPPPPPPPASNPAIAYRRYYRVSNQLTVPALYVMDANGQNQTRVYTNYIAQGNNSSSQSPDFPTWSSNGTKLCFVLNQRDLYTLDVNVVNGVPSGSNPIKIADGVAGGGSYGKGTWRPGTNDIAAVWYYAPDPTSIRIIPSTGGEASTLYTSPSIDFTINHRIMGVRETHLTFSPDGSMLAFFERQISTGTNFLKVLDLTTNTIVKNIDMSQFWAITALDWANTPGTGLIGFSAEPDGCIQVNAYHKIYTIDINAPSPTPVMVYNDVDDVSWSGDDSQIAFSSFSNSIVGGNCGARFYNGGVSTLTISTGTRSRIENTQGFNPDWKK